MLGSQHEPGLLHEADGNRLRNRYITSSQGKTETGKAEYGTKSEGSLRRPLRGSDVEQRLVRKKILRCEMCGHSVKEVREARVTARGLSEEQLWE